LFGYLDVESYGKSTHFAPAIRLEVSVVYHNNVGLMACAQCDVVVIQGAKLIYWEAIQGRVGLDEPAMSLCRELFKTRLTYSV
jgi:hypothetical protein